MATVFDGDLTVRGTGQFGNLRVPNNAVGDDQFNAAFPLTAVKQQHQHAQRFSQAFGTAAVSERRPVHVARAGGSLTEVKAGLVVACVGAATVVIQVLKNGTNVLTSTLTLDNSVAAFGSVLGAFGAVTYVAGDVFEVSATATAGGGTLGQGVFVGLTFREAAD